MAPKLKPPPTREEVREGLRLLLGWASRWDRYADDPGAADHVTQRADGDLLDRLVAMVGDHDRRRPLTSRKEQSRADPLPTTLADLGDLALRDQIAAVVHDLKTSAAPTTKKAAKLAKKAAVASENASEDEDVIEAKRHRAASAAKERDRVLSELTESATIRIERILWAAGASPDPGDLRKLIVGSRARGPVETAVAILESLKIVSGRKLATSRASAAAAGIERHADVNEWLLPYALELARVPKFLRSGTIAAATGTRRRTRHTSP